MSGHRARRRTARRAGRGRAARGVMAAAASVVVAVGAATGMLTSFGDD
ncbi:endoglucanase, partial [Streptomyces sp. SID5606]|nr:endoglucanase [Streptomyces sp. SID5606]